MTDTPKRKRARLDDSPNQYEWIIGELMTLQHDRRTAIESQNQIDNRAESFARSKLGFYWWLPEAERKAIRKQAWDLLELIKFTPEHETETLRFPGLSYRDVLVVAKVYRASIETRAVWDRFRINTEDDMAELAEQLPVYPWVRDYVRGFSSLGLAVIVGEVGDLGHNRNRPAGVWRRLGYSVENDGYRQGRLPPNLSKDERRDAWIERGYNPNRRAQAWAFIDHRLMQQQFQKGEPLGPYGEHYIRKKTEYLDRFANEKGGGKKHADVAARRYMAKMFLRDLWKQWCQVVPPPKVGFV